MAQEPSLQYGFGIEAGYTNNVNLTQEKEADIAVGIFADISGYTRSPSTEARVAGRVAYLDYLRNNASDEIRPDIRAQVIWHLDPRRWSWTIDGAAQQLRQSQQGTDSPSNRETSVTLLTGPDYRKPLTSETDLVSQARLGYAWNPDSDDDNASLNGALRLQRRLSPTSTVSGNAEVRAVRYLENDGPQEDGEELFDFNIVNAFGGQSWSDGRTDASVAAGLSFVQVQDADDRTNPFLRLDAAARFTPLRRIAIQLDVGYQDETTSLLERAIIITSEDEQPLDFGGGLDSRVANVFLQRRVRLTYGEQTSRRSEIAAELSARERQFVNDQPADIDNGQDEVKISGALSLSRRLTKNTRGRVFGTYEFTDFSDISLHYKDSSVGLELERRLSPNLFISARLRHQRRSSNDAEEEYTETATFISLSYRR